MMGDLSGAAQRLLSNIAEAGGAVLQEHAFCVSSSAWRGDRVPSTEESIAGRLRGMVEATPTRPWRLRTKDVGALEEDDCPISIVRSQRLKHGGEEAEWGADGGRYI